MAINQVEYKVIDSSGTTHIEKYDVSNFTQGYFYNGKFYDAESHVTELDAVNERIYIDIPTNRMYKYDGDYVLLSAGESVVFGYYYDDKFYTDSSFTEEIAGSEGVLYVDKSTHYIYAFDSLFGFGVVGDTSMPVYRILSNVEYSNHSSWYYAVGNHLIYNKILYKVIKPISMGDTLIRYEDDPTNGNIETEYTLQAQIEGKQNSTDNSLNTTSKTIVGAINELKGNVLSQTLAVGNTTVTFTVPTTGDHLIDFFTSTGINYTDIDTSVSGEVTLTFDAQESAVTVYCEIREA